MWGAGKAIQHLARVLVAGGRDMEAAVAELSQAGVGNTAGFAHASRRDASLSVRYVSADTAFPGFVSVQSRGLGLRPVLLGSIVRVSVQIRLLEAVQFERNSALRY